MKVTERTLVEMCRRINNDQLKHWDFGLKVEPYGTEYVVSQLFRKVLQGRPGSLNLFYGPPREVKAFIGGFANAVELANICTVNGAKSK